MARTHPIRLAILGCRGIPARYGGFETFAEELAPRLVERGFDVTVFADGREPPGPAEFRGVRVERVGGRIGGAAGTLLYDLSSLRRARGRFDVVLMLGYGAGGFLRLARGGRTRVWVAMDGREWRRRKWRAPARLWLRVMERLALRQADHVVFDSAAVRAEVAGPGADAGRTSVIEYGARTDLAEDPQVLEALVLARRRYYLLVARIEPENHVLEIVRAHARAGLARELVVVGDLERAGSYGRRCRAAGARTARFTGALFEPLHLFSLRAGAWGLLHGHSVGGTNPALLEGMASATPVLAHDNAYNREVLQDRGLWFASEDELVERLRAFDAWSEAERRALGEGARERVRARYTWERIVEEYAARIGPARAPAAHGPPAASAGVPAALPSGARERERAR